MPRVKKETEQKEAITLQAPESEIAPTEKPGIRTVVIEVPVGELVGNEQRRHIDLDLRAGKASIIRRITDGLDKQQATLENGQRVSNLTSALRWILEQVEAAV